MRYYPDMNDKFDIEELTRLGADDWMVKCLKMNPSYNSWGNYEDYMDKKDNWDGALEYDNITEGLWVLDDLNELVNFYFEIKRENKSCEHCDISGYNPETKQISDDYYDFSRTGKRWRDKLTSDEIEALSKYRNISIEEAKSRSLLNKCDALDRMTLIETRSKRLGVYGLCEYCEGEGYVYTEPKAKLALQLWYLHPRKGCSRGVYIKNIKREDLPIVIEWLQGAARRNAERFSKLSKNI